MHKNHNRKIARNPFTNLLKKEKKGQISAKMFNDSLMDAKKESSKKEKRQAVRLVSLSTRDRT